jgi:hypothetical protein
MHNLFECLLLLIHLYRWGVHMKWQVEITYINIYMNFISPFRFFLQSRYYTHLAAPLPGSSKRARTPILMPAPRPHHAVSQSTHCPKPSMTGGTCALDWLSPPSLPLFRCLVAPGCQIPPPSSCMSWVRNHGALLGKSIEATHKSTSGGHKKVRAEAFFPFSFTNAQRPTPRPDFHHHRENRNPPPARSLPRERTTVIKCPRRSWVATKANGGTLWQNNPIERHQFLNGVPPPPRVPESPWAGSLPLQSLVRPHSADSPSSPSQFSTDQFLDGGG